MNLKKIYMHNENEMKISHINVPPIQPNMIFFEIKADHDASFCVQL